MKACFPFFAVALLACGCHKTTLETASPSVAATIAPPLPSVKAVPTAPAATASPSAQPALTKDPTASTVAFLRALSRTIEQKRSLDGKADKVYTQAFASPQPRQGDSAKGNPHQKIASTRSGADLFSQTVIEQEIKTGALLGALTQVSTPPDCENLLNQYRELLQAQAAHNRHLSEAMLSNPQSDSTSPENETYRAEYAQKATSVNREIERARTSSPTVAAKVPPFQVP